jgi:hypothetical protein
MLNEDSHGVHWRIAIMTEVTRKGAVPCPDLRIERWQSQVSGIPQLTRISRAKSASTVKLIEPLVAV